MVWQGVCVASGMADHQHPDHPDARPTDPTRLHRRWSDTLPALESLGRAVHQLANTAALEDLAAIEREVLLGQMASGQDHQRSDRRKQTLTGVNTWELN